MSRPTIVLTKHTVLAWSFITVALLTILSFLLFRSVPPCSDSKQYIGRKAYGGWMICPLGLNPSSIVYSIGIGLNAEFDQEMIQKFQLKKLYAFDPTPKAIAYVERAKSSNQLSSKFELYPYAVVADPEQTTAKFFLPKNEDHVSGTAMKGISHVQKEPLIVKTLDVPRIMKMLGHDHIDLLKIDIEGSEFELFDSLLSNPEQFTYCNQVLVEQHSRFFPNQPHLLKRMIDQFRHNGFQLLHVERDEEYTFVRITPPNLQQQ